MSSNDRAASRVRAGRWLGALLTLSLCPPANSQGGSVVQVNGDYVLVINGEKVFPIGFSSGPPPDGLTPDGTNAWQELHDAGGTFIRTGALSGNWNAQVIVDEQVRLDAAAQYGMYCWVNLRELSNLAAGDTAKETTLRGVVNQFKNHPGLGMWKNFDEAWWGGVSVANLQRGYDVIKQEDASHPVVQTHAPRGTVQDLEPYNVAVDMLNLDIYPIGYPPGNHSLLANKEISMVGDWTQFLADVADGQKSYWMTLQIAWSGVINPGKTLRFPTFPQERFMAYQAIIKGARGLNFFGGHITSAMTPQDAQLGWNWTFWRKVLRPVVEELSRTSPLAPALVAPDSTLPIQMTGAADVEYCVRQSGRDLFILACKREGATVQVQFTGLPTWAGEGELLFEEPRKVQAQNGTFADWFGPFEVHAYRFRNPQTASFGDFDGDNDVDQSDFAHLQRCLSGAGVITTDPSCSEMDLNEDRFVDGVDVDRFLICLSGAGTPFDPGCVN